MTNAIQGILNSESVISKLEKESLAGTWDGEARQVSKYAEGLFQLNNGVKVPPSAWKCEKCDLTSNLWLNLTDGSILCGRKFFDGTGGNDHAVCCLTIFKKHIWEIGTGFGALKSVGESIFKKAMVQGSVFSPDT